MPPFNWFNRQQNQSSQPEPAPPEPEQTPPEPASPATPSSEAGTDAPAIAQDYLAWAKAAYQNIQKQQAARAAEQATPPAAAAGAPPTATPTAAPETAPETIEAPTTAGMTPPAEAEAIAEVAPSAAEAEASPAPVDLAPLTTAEAPAATVTSEEMVAVAASELSEAPAAVADLSEPSEIEDTVAPPSAVAASESGPPLPGEASSTPPSVTIETTDPQPVVSPAPTSPAQPLPFWAKAEAERLERLERLKAEAPEAPAPEVEPTPAPAATTSEELSELPDLPMDEGFLWSARVLAAQGRRADQIDLEEITWLKRLRQGLDKTRRTLINQLKAVVGQGPLNQDAVMEIESLLLQADVGVEATDFIIESLQKRLRQEALPPEQAIAYLKEILRSMLDRPYEQYSPTFAPEKGTLNIWLITGVNGAGKTTTIGKIAHVASKSGYSCLIGAADTFRAAAVQQVKVWGDRSNVEVIANPGKNTDPAAVVFDAISAAQARGTELLLIDTAGRLQNKKNLMEELSKIRRIIDKKAPDAKIESLLVLDSTLGQNGLRQAEVFSEVAQLSGVILTKLDGTAKGGIALAVVQQLGLPIRFIGAGEGIEDLRPFSSYEFVEALLSG
ncbi:MAG TPA: signal recognition particle-docking protein FtsY [Synechococcales cyanobacterium M55_K2018_004]|nr:signal recognition particle-docking protein FtsY [Synechococcales cyanobacterium M55_K2018_004]